MRLLIVALLCLSVSYCAEVERVFLEGNPPSLFATPLKVLYYFFLGSASIPLSSQWQKGPECPPGQKIDLIFAIKQQNLNVLDVIMSLHRILCSIVSCITILILTKYFMQKTFWQVSEPDSPKYGNFLTSEKVGTIIRPSEESVTTIVTWLQEHGVTNYSFTPNKEFLKAFVNVAKVCILIFLFDRINTF